MTKRTTAGVVFVMLHLLQRCSTTNVTTMIVKEEISTTSSITPSTLEQSMSSNTTLISSENSDSYVQIDNPQMSTAGVPPSTASTEGSGLEQVSTAGVPVSAIAASTERSDSEQVANASPTVQQSKIEEISSNSAAPPMKDNETNSEQSISTSTELPSTVYPIQNDTSLSNKSSDALVSSSKVTDSADELPPVGDVDTDDRDSIAEKETSNTYETQTQPTGTSEGKIENEVATAPPDDLTRAGIKIGEADARSDDSEEYETFSEPPSTMQHDSDVKQNGTTIATPMNLDSTTNSSINDTNGVEVMLLADDMVEPDEQNASRPLYNDDDADTKLPTEDIPMPLNGMTPSTKSSSDSSSTNIDSITNSPTIYASDLNETDEKTKTSENHPNLLTDFNFPSFDALFPNNTFESENNSFVQQQTNSTGTGVPSDNHNVTNMTSEDDSTPSISETFAGFQFVQVLADDLSFDNPENQSINEQSGSTNMMMNNTEANSASDEKSLAETIDDGNSDTESSSFDTDGITSTCDTPECQNTNSKTIFNNTADVNDTAGSFPQYTPNDQENMSSIQNTSADTSSSNDSQPFDPNEVDIPAGATLVENPVNDVPSNVPGEGTSAPESVTSSNNADSSMEEAGLSILGSESQVTEIGGENPVPSDEAETPLKSTAQDNYSTTSTTKQMLMKNYTVAMGDVLKIVWIKDGNQEVTSVSTARQVPQEQTLAEDNEDNEEVYEPVQRNSSDEVIEVLADDIIFGDDDKDEDIRPMDEKSKDVYVTTTTFKPYFISESYEPKPPLANCPFSAKTPDTKAPNGEQQRTVEHRPGGHIVEDPYYYEVDPFCLTRHHVLIPAVPVILPQWCFVPDTPDFMCPRYDLGFHIAFAHETQRDMYYRCVYGQAVLLKCPNLHYWDDDRKICTLMTDFNHYQRHRYHSSRNLYDHATHHHCQHCRRNFLLPQDLDPTAQCSDRMLLACNTDGTLSVYECPGFYYYDQQIQLRWYADLERCDYPADSDGPWR